MKKTADFQQIHRSDHTRNAVRLATARQDLRVLFEDLFDSFNQEKWLPTDPVQFVHRYAEKRDQELAGFIASLFAYGRASFFCKMLDSFLSRLGPNPYDFLLSSVDDKGTANGIYYRFHSSAHFEALLRVLRSVLLDYQSFEAWFSQKKNLEDSLSFISDDFSKRSACFSSKKDLMLMKYLVTSPQKKSACKRQLMFLRWMVRLDKIDVGIWKKYHARDLLIPVDTHIGRYSFKYGLRKGTERAAPSWKMAQEITANLRRLDPEDPVKYDFALTRLGMLKVSLDSETVVSVPKRLIASKA